MYFVKQLAIMSCKNCHRLVLVWNDMMQTIFTLWFVPPTALIWSWRLLVFGLVSVTWIYGSLVIVVCVTTHTWSSVVLWVFYLLLSRAWLEINELLFEVPISWRMENTIGFPKTILIILIPRFGIVKVEMQTL